MRRRSRRGMLISSYSNPARVAISRTWFFQSSTNHSGARGATSDMHELLKKVSELSAQIYQLEALCQKQVSANKFRFSQFSARASVRKIQRKH